MKKAGQIEGPTGPLVRNYIIKKIVNSYIFVGTV